LYVIKEIKGRLWLSSVKFHGEDRRAEHGPEIRFEIEIIDNTLKHSAGFMSGLGSTSTKKGS
jgi:hypothetical protein